MWIARWSIITSMAVAAGAAPALAETSILDGTVWAEVAKVSACNVDPLLLYSVALAESRSAAGRGFIRPHPFALRNEPSGSTYPGNQSEATGLLLKYIEEDRLTDIGAMQINYRWNGHRVANPADLLDLKTNITVGAQILCEAISANPGDIRVAIGGYHTRNPEREIDAISYGETVLYIWKRLREGV